MFVFKFKSPKGSFRDPLTISQQKSLSIPSKTVIGGLLGSILGEDNIFRDDFFSFKYSIVLNSHIIKKSYMQNYIKYYTERVEEKVNGNIDYYKNFMRERKKKITSKPTSREILLKPSYIVFVDGFIYENKIIKMMKNHETHYSIYMGNSEYPANYELLNIESISKERSNIINSITTYNSFDFGKIKEDIRIDEVSIPRGYIEDKRIHKSFIDIYFSKEELILKNEVDILNVKIPHNSFNIELI